MRRPAYGRAGRRLGRVVDLVFDPDPAGVPTVVAVVVGPHRWPGRLLGYARRDAHGPWLLERAAKLAARGMRTVPWSEVRIGDWPEPRER
jgi:hypothetical protein